ncbi:taurine ABC transporter permease TauC [Trinickia diaoshuihuensis]|uniref:taurine ABC transporter permease TauC n=1 Tax=Trinickia diaoshuihuensis TaxID=2292265 RepID=UPI000E21F56A|nr:taurine ABC transporter permease TauC [Trinickia diaoshuihuensis]
MNRVSIDPPQAFGDSETLDVSVSARERRRPRGIPSTAISAGTVAALVFLWWLSTRFGWIAPLFLPSPGQVVHQFQVVSTRGYMDATLGQHLWASLQRILAAFGAALATAIPCGVLIGRSRIARGVLDPLIEFYRPIPPLAYLPLIVIWFGIGEFAKALLIYLAIFAPIATSTANGVRNVDVAKLRAAQALGASNGQLIRYVVLPHALPDVLSGTRIGLGVGWSTLVAAELIAATRGLGFMVQSASQYLATDVVLVGILVIAFIAFALELGLRALQRRLVPWSGR